MAPAEQERAFGYASWSELPPPPSDPNRSSVQDGRGGNTQARRRSAGHRKKTKPQRSTVPAVAGVATLVVAAGGAFTLNNTVGSAQSNTASVNRAMPAAVPGGGSNIEDDRNNADERSARSDRANRAADNDRGPNVEAEQQRQQQSRERAQWEQQRAKELAQAEQRSAEDSKTTAVVPRVVQWVMPVKDYTLSASYGDSSGLWSSGTHTGQDFAASLGTEVHAIGDGTVEYVGWDGSYGKQVRIQHEDGTETWYSHLSDYAVSTGETVAADDVIAYVGSTGNSTGSHLHLEVRPGGGDPVDPLPWMRELGLPV